MRVAVIIDSIERGPVSVGNYTKNLIKELIKIADKDVEFVLIRCQNANASICKKAEEVFFSFPVKRASNSFFPLKLLSFAKRQISEFAYSYKLQSEILNEGIDILHIPHLAGATAPPLGFYNFKTLTGVKLIITLHGVAPLVVPQNLYYKDKDTLSRTLTYIQVLKWKYVFRNKIDLIITVSESEKRNISQKLSIPDEKIRVIYHGVGDNFKPLENKEYIRKKLKEKYEIDSSFIFHVSAYQPKKNVEGIIKAFAICKKKYKIKEKLVIGGKQPEHLKALSKRLGIEKDVIFTGYIYEEDLPLFYNVAEVFVFPSFHESFGLPILEAMACGCPVITSNVFSMPEIAGDTVILINPYKIEEMAEAIYHAISDESLRKKLKRKGLKKAEQFTWEKCAKEHLRVYEEVCLL